MFSPRRMGSHNAAHKIPELVELRHIRVEDERPVLPITLDEQPDLVNRSPALVQDHGRRERPRLQLDVRRDRPVSVRSARDEREAHRR